MQSDQELVALANKGDADAFEQLYRRYRDWVYRLAWRFTGNDADALDVVQETFGYLLGKFPGFELTAAMTTFLYPAVKHLSMTANRKRRRQAGDEELLVDVPAPTSDGTSRSELASVLASLPRDQREVLLMRFVDDMKIGEIAHALDISEGTIKSRIHHALRKLREDRRTREYFLE